MAPTEGRVAKPERQWDCNIHRKHQFQQLSRQQQTEQHPVQWVHTGKYRTADKLKRHTTDLNREKETTQNREAKLPWFSRLLWQSGNKVGLFYNAPEQTCS